MGTTFDIEHGPADRPSPERVRPAEGSKRLRTHALLLLLLLLALLPVAGHRAVWSADEGALLYQVSALADGRGWRFDHPFPAADPGGTYFPIHLSSWDVDTGPSAAASDGRCDRPDGCGYIVLAKHSVFLWLSAGLYRLGGYSLLLVMSAVATALAAAATGRLASMIDPRAAVPGLWAAGLASPLFIDGYVAWAHTVAAALIGWGCVGLLTRHHRIRWRSAGLVMLFVACQIRTEAPLAGIAIGLALLAAAAPTHRSAPGSSPTADADSDVVGRQTPRALRRDRALTGMAALATVAVGIVVDRATAVDTGGPVEPVGFDEAFGFLAGRLEAFSITWLRPAYGAAPLELLVLLAATLTLVAGVLARRGQARAGVVTGLLIGSTLALAARFAIAQAALIPGLVIAFPTLFVGLFLLDRRRFANDRLAVVFGGFVLFCGAVLATQYRLGGGGEWGGRYFAVGLPLGIAAAAVGFITAGDRFSVEARRRIGGLLIVSMALLSAMGLLGLRAVRQQTEDLALDIGAAIDESNGDPVVLSSIDGLGRWMWREVDNGRWLRVPEDELATVAARLDSLGVDQIVLITADNQQQLTALDTWYRPSNSLAAPEAERSDYRFNRTESSNTLPVFLLRSRR